MGQDEPRTQEPLTPEQLRRYEADGFLVLPGYLDARAVVELSRAADEVLARCGPLTPDNPRLQVDRDAADIRSVGGVTGVRQAYPVIDLSERLARLAADERIVGLFRALFGGDTPVLFEDKLNYKQPGVGTAFPMHQDYSYWQDYSPRLASALVYLDAASEENGCLEVVPGRHREGLLQRTEVNVGPGVVDHYIPEGVLDPASCVPAGGPAGTVVLFSCLTPHRSAPNRSGLARRALILTYNPSADGSGYEATSGAARERARAWRESLAGGPGDPPGSIAGAPTRRGDHART